MLCVTVNLLAEEGQNAGVVRYAGLKCHSLVSCSRLDREFPSLAGKYVVEKGDGTVENMIFLEENDGAFDLGKDSVAHGPRSVPDEGIAASANCE